MLTDYIQSAMRHAHYEIMENGHYWGEIPNLQGVWANAETLEECRETLREVLEDWLMIGLRHNNEIPIVNGIDLNRKTEAA
ncbi:MAG: type II toxin-antitoxin system HicB family antitoxin [Armatimonadota bacterium]